MMLFQFPSNGKGDGKRKWRNANHGAENVSIPFKRESGLQEVNQLNAAVIGSMFLFPSNGKGYRKLASTACILTLSTTKLSFNSLQTGKGIASDHHWITGEWYITFQFPSNGKGDRKATGEYPEAVLNIRFQFPSNGKGDRKSLMHTVAKVLSDWFQFPSNGKGYRKGISLGVHGDYETQLFQFPSNGKGYRKESPSLPEMSSDEEFLFPSNGKGDRKKNTCKCCGERPIFCFNSLQTGKGMASR